MKQVSKLLCGNACDDAASGALGQFNVNSSSRRALLKIWTEI
jgi:hypothetical protein